MKFHAITIAVLLAVSGCSSTKEAKIEGAPITALTAQKLSTSFKRQGVKIEWDCIWGTGMFDATCIKTDIKSIEVTGYATSFGNSEVMREQSFKVAHDVALDKLIRFVKQDITSNRVVSTLGKNVEKAQDRIKNRIKSDEDVAMSDEDVGKDTNFAVRENTNDTVRNFTETIRTNSQGIIRGARAIDESIVDRQTVGVTIRWDTSSEKASTYLRKRFISN